MEAKADNPPVSVIIPTYNRAWCLAEALDSVMAQDFRDFELIVVDDGSTDETPSVLARYPRCRVARMANRGVSAARNLGVEMARGRWVAFLDSDDLWMSRKLSCQMEFFAAAPRALICQTQEIWRRNGKRVNPGKRHEKPSGMFFERSLELCLVSPSAVMMERALFCEMGGFDESLPACEDYDLWLRIGLVHEVHLIPDALVIKRGGHEDQLSRAPGLDRHRIAALVKILRNSSLSPGQRAAALAVLEKKCAVYAQGCQRRGRTDEARYYSELAAKPFLGEKTLETRS